MVFDGDVVHFLMNYLSKLIFIQICWHLYGRYQGAGHGALPQGGWDRRDHLWHAARNEAAYGQELSSPVEVLAADWRVLAVGWSCSVYCRS
jgi:hypothetical protein